MFEWLVSLVPWWLWLVLAAIAIGAVWRLFGWRGAIAAAGLILPVLGFRWATNLGAERERSKATDRNLNAMKDRKEIDDEIDQLGSNDVDERFARWMRDDDR